jgi:CO/xanthine dehydrogenase FAD-binding subunit
MPVAEFVTGDNANALAPGELLRSIHLPAAALARRTAFRHVSLTKLGRSAALLIGTSGEAGDLVLTITASVDRPIQLRFAAMPGAAELRDAIDGIPTARWFTDPHGAADYKRHVSLHLGESIRAELSA